MTVRPLRLLGDPVLRTPCDPVVRFDDALARLVTDLLDTVAEPGRAGLAANQIGSGRAIFSYDVDGQLGYVINPRVVELRDSSDGPEACLSIPGISAIRTRAEYAVVEGVDLGQEPVVVAGGERTRPLPAARDRPPARQALHRRSHRRRAPPRHAAPDRARVVRATACPHLALTVVAYPRRCA